ncbi:disease resistance protein Roq1-like [Bidens hawaiensis]|uniref:disease resistance protein Roq1-like n=1 Tax=Bidens hawaiensis TaxID=980011 RepID=UPI00404939FA
MLLSRMAFTLTKMIKKGKMISDELISSIQDSKFYIIVFSKNYASSSWCLDELVKIMECQRTNEHTAYPVFYDVEPKEIRNQSGVVREAFSKHVNDEAEERWRDALKEAAGLDGWELKNTFYGHEAQFIQKIVEEISQELRFINSSIDEKLIGMETRVKDVVSSLETNIYDVRMIGIKGMGGAGKTTLARVVFDQISFRFEGSSFVENVRENSKNPSCGLKSLQKQVLSDVLKANDITVNGVYEGKKLMKQRMCCIMVLVVLDDVDHIDQLEALVGELSWFKPGSRVIITTREEQVLVAHGVPKNMILDVKLLSYEEAICLFNRCAFGREVPKKSYKELSRQVVRYAAGLPLTIKVLGSFLRGKDELEYWTDALERLKTIPLKETQEILEISYNGLEEDYKEIFLDVACILKGWKKTKAIIALESCGLHGTSGLRVLEQKSLITITDNGILGMHDHIEEMGKNIVRRSYPNLPYRHSRLWIGEEIEGVLVEDRGAEATRCIILKSLDPEFIMKGLRNMNELILLVVTGGSTIRDRFNNNTLRVNCYNLPDVEEDGIDLPDSLRYICWNNYPYTCLPKNFIGNNLVGLEMHSSNLRQLWKGAVKMVPKLKFIGLTNCDLKTFDIGLTKNLERLQLNYCSHLVELRMPIGSYKLKSLSIACCKLITTMDLVGAQNLETLEVRNCDDLVELRMPTESSKLKSLSIAFCKLIRTLDLVLAQNLETLEVKECDDLVELHMPIESFNLKSLSISIACCRLISTLDLVRLRISKQLKLENVMIW